MLKIKNLTLAMLLAGVSALSFAQAPAAVPKGTSTTATYPDAGAEKPGKTKPKKTKKTKKKKSSPAAVTTPPTAAAM